MTLLHAAENVGPYRLVQQVIDDTDYDAYLFQDADDWSAPDRLEKLLEGAAATGAELIGSQEIRVFCDEPEVVPIQWPLDGNAPFDDVPTAFTCLHPTSLVSRDLVQAVGGFSSGLRFGGDAEFLRRAHWIATVANVPHYGYLRRIRQDSLTTAPATAIGTPARKELMEETFARARANHELVEQGLEPDLSPLRTRGPVELRHLCGPPLHGMSGATQDRPPTAPVCGRTGAQASPPVPVFVRRRRALRRERACLRARPASRDRPQPARRPPRPARGSDRAGAGASARRGRERVRGRPAGRGTVRGRVRLCDRCGRRGSRPLRRRRLLAAHAARRGARSALSRRALHPRRPRRAQRSARPGRSAARRRRARPAGRRSRRDSGPRSASPRPSSGG